MEKSWEQRTKFAHFTCITFAQYCTQVLQHIYRTNNWNVYTVYTLCIANKRVPDVLSIEKLNILCQFDVWKLIETTPKKSCVLDPTPTTLAIGCIDVLLPVITKIINSSLQSGVFAVQWKCTLVSPLLKKRGLELLRKNYLPANNLQYISKLKRRLFPTNA